MSILIYLSIAFILLQLMNVLLNFLFPQRITNKGGGGNEKVSILIPARNEEANIAHLLGDLMAIGGERWEILVCDDQSIDRTAEVVRTYAARDSRISLLRSEGLPAGWLGKNHACFQLAQAAQGRYLLFLDADVRVQQGVIEDAVGYMKEHRLGLLSLFPFQVQCTLGEKMTVPLMNYILLTLLPLIFVRVSPFTSHAAANGQFMLFDASIYRLNQPHRLMKQAVVEDIAIARYYKSQKIRVACLAGERRVQCRMYHSYREALEGFSKNIFQFFGGVRLAAFLFWFGATFGLIPLLFSSVQGWLSYLAAIVLVQILYAKVSHQNIGATLLLFPTHLFFMLHVMVRAIIVKKNRKYQWKGREIY